MPAPKLQTASSVSAGKRRLLLYAYGGCVPLMTLLAAASWSSGRLDLAGVGSACVLIAVIGWWNVRRGRNLVGWGVAFLVASAAMAGVAVVMSGGALSGAITWLFLLPPMAGLLFGSRAAALMASSLGIGFVGLVIAHARLGNWRDVETLDQAALLAAVSHTLALALLFMLTRVTGKILNSSRASLETARDEADRANAVKGAFLANMSHEIRTPLNGILGMSELALTSTDEQDRQESFETIHRCTEALLAIVNDILDLSKIDAGELVLEEIPFEVESLIEGITTSFASPTRARGLDFEAVIDPGCPQRLIGDPVRIGQILTNLVGNASKFTMAGSIAIRVDWVAEQAELRMRVEDTGIGIANEKIDLLFEEFTQADTSTTRQFGGTGLGLAITKRLAEAMGGRILVRSEEGVGSQFQCVLPLRSASEAETRRGVGLAGKRIAVLEPSDLVRQAVEATASGLGIRAVQPQDFDEADLIVLSAEMDATELHATLRVAERRGMPCLVLRQKGASNQAADHTDLAEIALPLNRAQLRVQLRDLLEAEPAPTARADPIAADSSPLAWLCEAAGERAVLLVEDNRVNAKVARAHLERAGVRVVHVENGQLALEKVQCEEFALVLMDCQMPVLDGYAATRAIRALPGPESKVKIVAMTAHAMAGDRERCLEAGMDDYVTKPLRVPDLARTLRVVMMRRAA